MFTVISLFIINYVIPNPCDYYFFYETQSIMSNLFFSILLTLIETGAVKVKNDKIKLHKRIMNLVHVKRLLYSESFIIVSIDI